jgi:hypothetical protein
MRPTNLVVCQHGALWALQVGRLHAVLGSGEAALEAYLEPRHVVDVLEDFAPARPPLEKVR